MCKLDTCVIVDAKRLGIPGWQLMMLHEEFHRVHGVRCKPKGFLDLLEVVM